jgi:bifunctional UDP-N-acetylglucosamine pyrophosphorylase/glucosamine-1-phosphate N-acetyltransferase
LSDPAGQIGAVVLAAGRSTRFRSTRSKLVHSLAGQPIIEWVLGTLRAADVAPIVVVVAPESDEVRATCGSGVEFAIQHEPRGTGHAVQAAATALGGFDGSVLVLYGDLPMLRAETLRGAITMHRAADAAVTLLTATVDNPHGWGRIIRGGDGAVGAIVEERDASAAERAVHEVNVGVYCVRVPLLFDLLRQVTPNNAQGEIYLTDIIARAVSAGLRIADVPVDVAEVAQINSREELAAMETVLRTQINGKWMESGVTLEDPNTAYIGAGVTIGRDTVVGPNVHLRGRTAIGEGCRIDGSAYVIDSVIGDGTHLRFGVAITGSRIGARCVIGPFANLRAQTRLADEVHIGDFVETKNAALGPGTKANHLAYLGDAEIGAGTNIGAGTITCNYDGFAKHRTVIGDRVQVGSDSTLVAPITVGDDAYVATATTVRRDVSPGALVFNPRDQEERPGWVAGFRARQGTVPSADPAKAPARPRAKSPPRKARVSLRTLRTRKRRAR